MRRKRPDGDIKSLEKMEEIKRPEEVVKRNDIETNLRKGTEIKPIQGKNARRISLNVRHSLGLTLSSGIDSFLDVPNVESSKLCEYISIDLAQPQRMRQLLVWISQLVFQDLNEKFKDKLAPEGLLESFSLFIQDLLNCRINTSWYAQKEKPEEVKFICSRSL